MFSNVLYENPSKSSKSVPHESRGYQTCMRKVWESHEKIITWRWCGGTFSCEACDKNDQRNHQLVLNYFWGNCDWPTLWTPQRSRSAIAGTQFCCSLNTIKFRCPEIQHPFQMLVRLSRQGGHSVWEMYERCMRSLSGSFRTRAGRRNSKPWSTSTCDKYQCHVDCFGKACFENQWANEENILTAARRACDGRPPQKS